MNALPREFKVPLPDAIEAECALLGGLLHSNDIYWRVAGFLKPQHFSDQVNAMLYETIGTMITEGRPVNPITIKPYLPVGQMVGDLPLFAYVVRLVSDAIGTLGAYDYGRSIIEMWARRQLISAALDLDSMARNMPVDMTPEKIISATADNLTRIAMEGNERAASLKYGVILPKAISEAERSSADTSALIPWFVNEVTLVAGDMRRGNLIGLMADSGAGKTSFSLQQCRYAALSGFRTAFFSIEITDEEAALQAAAQAAGISLGRLDAFTLNSRERADIEAELSRSVDIPFDIVAFAECSLSDIVIKIEAMKKSVGLDLVVIDHARMISLPGKPTELFADRVNMLYRGLKGIAKKLKVAIVILIQRNEEWKARVKAGGTPRPMMGDAFGGGSIRQNLDVWFSLYRPEPLYKELIASAPPERISEGARTNGAVSRREEWIKKYDQSRGMAAIINHKRRRGEPGGSRQIIFEAEFTRFSSPATQQEASFEGFFEG